MPHEIETPQPGASSAVAHLESHPFLGDFAVPLPRLSGDEDRDDPEPSVSRMGDLLRDTDVEVTVRIRVVDDDREQSWTVASGAGQARVEAEGADIAEVEVIVAHSVWRSLVAGEVAPLEAFGRPGLRLRGDVQAARRLVRGLRATAENARPEGR